MIDKALKDLGCTEEESLLFKEVLSSKPATPQILTSSTNIVLTEKDVSNSYSKMARLPFLGMYITTPVDSVVVMEHGYNKSSFSTIDNQYVCQFVKTSCYSEVLMTKKKVYIGKKGKERAWRWCYRNALTI